MGAGIGITRRRRGAAAIGIAGPVGIAEVTDGFLIPGTDGRPFFLSPLVLARPFMGSLLVRVVMGARWRSWSRDEGNTRDERDAREIEDLRPNLIR